MPLMATDEKPKRRNPEVFANNCPKCNSSNTRVRTTLRIIRYCICRVCGHHWRQTPKE